MTAHAHALRFGVLGTGRISRKLGPAIARVAGLAAVASRDAAKGAAWAGEFGATRSYGSYAALLDDPDLDAVYIALPPSLHREWTIKAAEHGMHVLCEKPLAATLADAQEMAAACRRHGVQLMDGVMWVHTPRAATMTSVLASGTLGDLRRVTSAFTFRAEGWDDGEFRLAPDLGGGSLLDLGWYCVGATLWAFSLGHPLAPSPTLPLSVSATATWHGGVDVSLSALVDFGDGRFASFDCGFETVIRKWFEIAGTKGNLVCDDFTRPWSPEKARFWTHDAFGQATAHLSEPFAQEECLVEGFCRAIRTGPDHTWAERAVDVQRICETLLRSAREKRPIALALSLGPQL